MSMLDAMTAELEVARKIFWLVRNDHIFLSGYNHDNGEHDDGAYPTINCNDLFVPGADAQPLDAEELDDYIAVVKRWPWAGSAAWCAVKRAANPWRVSGNDEWTAEYEEAVAGIPKLLAERRERAA